MKGWYPNGHDNALTDDNYEQYRVDLDDLREELNDILGKAKPNFGLNITIPEHGAVVYEMQSPTVHLRRPGLKRCNSDITMESTAESISCTDVYKGIKGQLNEQRTTSVRKPSAPDSVGFYILGGHLTKLKHSMDQRIEHALKLALDKHKKQPHIYFVSGYKKGGAMSEAEYMAKKILEKYESSNLPAPVIVMDNEAMFTVMNFLKTIPLINKFKGHIKKVYLVTSDYHISRSEGILKQFVDNDLTGNVEFVSEGAKHPATGEAGHDPGTSPRVASILDERRDRSNARCFAEMCGVIKTHSRFNANMFLNPEQYSPTMVRLHKDTYWEAFGKVEALVKEYQDNNIATTRDLPDLLVTKNDLENKIGTYHVEKLTKQNGYEIPERMYQELVEIQMRIDSIEEAKRGKEVQLIQFALDFKAPFDGFCFADSATGGC